MDNDGKKPKISKSPTMSALDLAAYFKLMSETLSSAGKSLVDKSNDGGDLSVEDVDSALDEVLNAFVCSSSALLCCVGQVEKCDRAAAGIERVERSLHDGAPILMPYLELS